MADNRSKSMNCKKSMKQNRNPTRLRILPFILFTTLTTAFKSIQIVGWFSQNHRTTNKAREPHIIWQRPLFSLPPSHRAPRASFFLLPQHLYNAKRPLRRRELRAYCNFESKQENSITLFRPRPNNYAVFCFTLRSTKQEVMGQIDFWVVATKFWKFFILVTFALNTVSQKRDLKKLTFLRLRTVGRFRGSRWMSFSGKVTRIM